MNVNASPLEALCRVKCTPARMGNGPFAMIIMMSEIVDYIKELFKCLYIEESTASHRAIDAFLNKINTLESSLPAEKKFKEPFKILKAFNWGKVYKSPCHGDLTLENIIITEDKKLCLIDFLDSFYNSWMIDIANGTARQKLGTLA